MSPETPPVTESKRPSFGSNQKIALGVLVVPFLVATVALFMGQASFVEWAGFVQVQTPIVTAIVLGSSATIKCFKARGR